MVNDTTQHRRAELHRRNRRGARAAWLAEAWSARGVPTSRVSDDRRGELLGRLRGAKTGDYAPADDLRCVVADVVDGAPFIVVMGWDVDEEPALLLPGQALQRSEEDLRSVYVDGLLIWGAVSVLIIDFGEIVGEVYVRRCELDAPAP